ncbi:MAG: hypothetical protein ABI589_10265 [Burkholderiales bacterium]
MKMQKAREIRKLRRRANERGGWHRVLFLMMVAVALAGVADARKQSPDQPLVASAGK